MQQHLSINPWTKLHSLYVGLVMQGIQSQITRGSSCTCTSNLLCTDLLPFWTSDDRAACLNAGVAVRKVLRRLNLQSAATTRSNCLLTHHSAKIAASG